MSPGLSRPSPSRPIVFAATLQLGQLASVACLPPPSLSTPQGLFFPIGQAQVRRAACRRARSFAAYTSDRLCCCPRGLSRFACASVKALCQSLSSIDGFPGKQLDC
ncbi:hypothetical protein K523DRAFT_320778 [Schizophyllum commune Tattone D]|nr:hypothetical protein K523DRAFT_320778 [Schizophyllum commune Tattone D]